MVIFVLDSLILNNCTLLIYKDLTIHLIKNSCDGARYILRIYRDTSIIIIIIV